MLSGYNVHREEDRVSMLETIGLSSIDELFAAIPAPLRMKRQLALPIPLSEWDLERNIRSLAARNHTTRTHLSFLGGGMYEHYIPAAVDALITRGEYLTAYTPYQPEMSQGLLQALWEYQQSMSAIAGLPLVNCSGYDGATSFADSAWVACQVTGRKVIAIGQSVWPQYREVLETFLTARGVRILEVTADPVTGQVDEENLRNSIRSGEVGGFLFQSPNAFGVMEDMASLASLCREKNVISSVSFHPFLSGLFKTPGEAGIDIATCEGQPLGIPLSAGGATLGVFATHKKFRSHLPGRLVGTVADIHGRPAYALIYEDREQHVARERATSNICSNQALHAIRALLYLSLLGEGGFREVARLNAVKAHYLAAKLCDIPGVRLTYAGPFFNEFLLDLPMCSATIVKRMLQRQIFAGIDYSSCDLQSEQRLLVAVTEVRSRVDLDVFAGALREAIVPVSLSCR